LVGAPWDIPVNRTQILRTELIDAGRFDRELFLSKKMKLAVTVGNGGVALRSKSFMLHCLAAYVTLQPLPEDVFFSQCLALLADNQTILAPTVEEATQFAAETVFHPHPVFIHQFFDLYKLHGLEKARDMLNHCPESFFLADALEAKCQKEIRRTTQHDMRIARMDRHERLMEEHLAEVELALEKESEDDGDSGNDGNETSLPSRPSGLHKRKAAALRKELELKALILNKTMCKEFVDTLAHLRLASEVVEPPPPSSRKVLEHAYTFEKPRRKSRKTSRLPEKKN